MQLFKLARSLLPSLPSLGSSAYHPDLIDSEETVHYAMYRTCLQLNDAQFTQCTVYFIDYGHLIAGSKRFL